MRAEDQGSDQNNIAYISSYVWGGASFGVPRLFYFKIIKKSIDKYDQRAYYIIRNREHTTREDKNMTQAEQRAIRAREKDLMAQGVEKEIAKVMAKVELETGLIKVVVNGN